ncbi:MAG: hypothetical protein ACE363_04500 [Alphaproteobacteria bacterium]
MNEGQIVEAACRAYWGDDWGKFSRNQQVSHRARFSRAMETLKRSGWSSPLQVLGVQIRSAANEAYIAEIGHLIDHVYDSATEPLPDID